MKICLSASSILYHITTISRLNGILIKDVFRCSPAIGTSADKGSKMFFMSMSRSVHGKYNKMSCGRIQLVLDGQKLAANHSIGPTDYWQYQSDEMEDRLVTNKQYIKNFSKFIKEIHVLTKDSYNSIEGAQKKVLRNVILMCKKKKIPIYLYDNEEAAQFLKKEKAISIKEANLKTGKIERAWPPYRRKDRYTIRIIELLYKKNEKDLSKEAADFKYRYCNDYRKSDFIKSVENDIHNSRNFPNEYIEKVLDFMQKHNLRSVGDLFNWIMKKWS